MTPTGAASLPQRSRPDDLHHDDLRHDACGADETSSTTSTRSARSTSSATGASSRFPQPAGPDPEPDPFEAFLSEATRRRKNRPTQDPTSKPADWVETDPETIRRLLERRNPVDRMLERSKPGHTQVTVRNILRRACAMMQGIEHAPSLSLDAVRMYPWHEMTVDQAADLRRLVYRRYDNQSTRNDHVSVVRRVVQQCFKAALISATRRELLYEELYTLAPGVSTKRRRLEPWEIAALLHCCENTGTPASRARNTAIVAVFRTSGMRSCELTALRLEDWDRDANTLYLRDTKNGRPHRVYLHRDAVPYLERWVRVRGDFPGPLFTSVNGSDPTRFLGRQTVQEMLRIKAVQAGIEPFGSHDFRRTFATELLRTHDIVLVSKLLNHAKPASTFIYDLSGEDEQRGAVGHLTLPGVESLGLLNSKDLGEHYGEHRAGASGPQVPAAPAGSDGSEVAP